MTKSKHIPKRRFKEFELDGEWEQEKLGEISNITAGGDVVKEKLLTKGNYPVLANAHTNEGVIGYYEEDYQVEAPAVTVTGRGDIGFAKARKENFTPVVRLLSVKSEHNVDFLAEAINQNNVVFESTGVPQLTIPKLSNYKVYFPSTIGEENSIGNFLVSFDSLIALHQHKLDKLKNLKKSYLAELFPAEGERVPKRRFPGFEGEWEEKKLGEVVEKFDNLRIPVASKDRIAGNIPYYGANGIQDYVEGFTHDGEFVLLAEDGANDLNDYPVQYVNGKVWVNNHAHVIQGKNNLIDNKFLLFAIKQIQMEPYLVGGGRAKLNAEIMMSLPLTAPEISEQRMIGAFLMKVEKQISLQQQKLNKLKDLKKAYLNELFV